MLKRWMVASGLLALAFAANATLLLREPYRPQRLDGAVRVDLAGLEMQVPRALILDPAQLGGGRLLRLDLALDRQRFTAMPPESAPLRGVPEPEKIHLVLSNPGLQPTPADQLQQLYARFLTPETLNTASGLVLRRFRTGSPYEDRDLFIGAGQFGGGTGRLFIALCPRGGTHDVEPCSVRLRHERVEIELRFPASALPDWRRLTTEALKLVGALRGVEAG